LNRVFNGILNFLAVDQHGAIAGASD
jgi:hypothetical protein